MQDWAHHQQGRLLADRYRCITPTHISIYEDGRQPRYQPRQPMMISPSDRITTICRIAPNMPDFTEVLAVHVQTVKAPIN